MKKTVWCVGIILVLLLTSVDVMAQGMRRIEERIANHQARVDQGIASGQLTHREAKAVQNELNRISAEYRHAKRQGPLNPGQIAHFNRMLDENSRRIYFERHDQRRALTPGMQRIEERIANQQARIDRCISLRKATHHETRPVRHRLNHIDAEYRKSKGYGPLNPGQIAHFNRMLDENSRRIQYFEMR